MLADLLPMMTDTVRQWHGPARDIFGRQSIQPPSEHWDNGGVSMLPGKGSITEHLARVIYSPGSITGPASREATADAAATVWLIDHPHPVAIGSVFEVPNGPALKVVRWENRTLPEGTLTKVYLS